MTLTAEALSSIFSYLDKAAFHRTQRLPLVAARQWSWVWEREAWKRFVEGKPNLGEVAWPALYWSMVARRERELFRRLTLGRPDPKWRRPAELSPLFPEGDSPRFCVISRFGRFILRHHPAHSGDDFVYFGDDTLHLMEHSRRLLQSLQQQVNEPLRCLDLCCGGGGVGLALPDFEGELLGIDLNPLAVELAQKTAQAQELFNYSYQCQDVAGGLPGSFHLIFGNPPTLSPSLTGKDVFHATGTWEAFEHLLGLVLKSLLPEGRGVFTLFSEWAAGRDEAWESLRGLLAGKRGFTYTVRREFPLGSGRSLRHCVVELLPESQPEYAFVDLPGGCYLLPGHTWRKP